MKLSINLIRIQLLNEAMEERGKELISETMSDSNSNISMSPSSPNLYFDPLNPEEERVRIPCSKSEIQQKVRAKAKVEIEVVGKIRRKHFDRPVILNEAQ
jgi:hypothetical protein